MGRRKAECTPEEWQKILENNRKFRKRKADYSPEEWAKHLEKEREYRRNMPKEAKERRLAHMREMAKKYAKRKKDYTPEEWQKKLEKERERERNRSEEQKLKKKEYAKRYRATHKSKKKEDYTEEEWAAKLERNRMLYKINKERRREIQRKSEKKTMKNNKLLFEKYAHRLTIDEDPKRDKDGFLMVRDYYTKEYFYPTLRSIKKRLQCLNGINPGEGHLYSCEQSKRLCPVFGASTTQKFKRKKRINYSRSKEWISMVLERARGVCERCGLKTPQLEAHHKIPIALCAMFAGDIDNGIALCKKCHREVHETEGCTLLELSQAKKEEEKGGLNESSRIDP